MCSSASCGGRVASSIEASTALSRLACSLRYIRLQPLLPTVAASYANGFILRYLRLLPLLPPAAADTTAVRLKLPSVSLHLEATRSLLTEPHAHFICALTHVHTYSHAVRTCSLTNVTIRRRLSTLTAWTSSTPRRRSPPHAERPTLITRATARSLAGTRLLALVCPCTLSTIHPLQVVHAFCVHTMVDWPCHKITRMDQQAPPRPPPLLVRGATQQHERGMPQPGARLHAAL